MDAVGSNIRVDARGREVMRVLPRLNEDVNEEWISDKTRFACDGLGYRRLDRPYVKKDGKLQEASWNDAFAAIASALKGKKGSEIAAIAGDLADAEAMMALKDLMTSLGSPNLDCRQDGAKLDPTNRVGYLFNTTIAGIEQADVCLLIGVNPRADAAIVNARLRKRHRAGGFKVYSIGPEMDLTYPVETIGNSPQILNEIRNGNHAVAEALKNAEHPMLIVGQTALARPDGAAVLAAARAIADSCGLIKDGWNGFNVLHTVAARVAGLDIGFVPGEGGKDVAGILDGASKGEIGVVFLLGADEIDMSRLGNAFVIYQGSHGDAGAHRADVILPGAAYTEKNSHWVNTEGRVQLGWKATFPPGDAREDWTILRAFSDVIGKKLPYDTLDALRRRMVEAAPHFANIEQVTPAEWGAFGKDGPLGEDPFKVSSRDTYFLTNPICRASKTMAKCTEAMLGVEGEATGTHG
jgi:NADH-quinone oxidoreductase subunit G